MEAGRKREMSALQRQQEEIRQARALAGSRAIARKLSSRFGLAPEEAEQSTHVVRMIYDGEKIPLGLRGKFEAAARRAAGEAPAHVPEVISKLVEKGVLRPGGKHAQFTGDARHALLPLLGEHFVRKKG